MTCMTCDSPYHRRCSRTSPRPLAGKLPIPMTHSAWRALDALRLLNQQARRNPSTDDAAVRIAVRRLRGNQLT